MKTFYAANFRISHNEGQRVIMTRLRVCECKEWNYSPPSIMGYTPLDQLNDRIAGKKI